MKKAVAYLIPFIEQEKLDRPELATAKDTNGTIVMATVKGDVHDIGKNIVGVVLQCNNYEVVDLGVMVPAQKILDTAARDRGRRDRPVRPDHAQPRRDGQRRRRDAAAGLHDPAADRRRDDLARPHRGQGRPEVRRPRGLGQGRLAVGAGDGRAARRPAARRSSWPTCRPTTTRCAPATRPRTTGRWPPSPRRAPRARRSTGRATGRRARACCSSRTTTSRRTSACRAPASTCGSSASVDLAELRRYIDWQPFFNAWEMKGSFPDILDDAESGETARKLYDDAQTMLDRIVDEGWLTANGVVGLFPANAVGDDIEVYLDEERGEPHAVLHHLRQQGAHRAGRAQPLPGRLRRPQGDRPQGLRRRCSRSRPGSAPHERIEAVQGRDRRLLRRSCSSRWPTGSPRRSPSGCTSASAASCGATRPTSTSTSAAADQGAVRRHPARARATPPAPTTPRSRSLWDLLDVEANTGMKLTESMAMWPGRLGVGHLLQPPGVAVLRGRPAGPRPGRRLRRAQGLDPRRGRALALAQPRLRPGGLTPERGSVAGSTPSPRVLWDMDGTLVDTEPYWIAAEFALAERYGGTWSREHALDAGRQRPARLRPLHPRAHGHRRRARARSSTSCSTR